ncbi:PEGA domain-containing protein [Myxococcota bacterium]|nr:PEGA domain-containing protein [Myxococcota bacterium]
MSRAALPGRVGLAIVAALALVTTDVPVAFAAPTPEALAEGKRAFDEGVALLEDARYADAARALERSVELFESPSAVYNLGLAYRGLGALTRAIARFERFLVIATAQHDALRTGAKNLLAELERDLAHVRVELRGAPETVTLDGAPLALPSPSATLTLTLDPGDHELVATRRGFEPVRERLVNLARGEHRAIVLDASKAQLTATLTITTMPSDVIVRVDGEVRGAGTVELALAPGPHVVEAAGEGLEPATRTLTLEAGTHERVTLELVRTEAPLTSRWWFWAGAALVAGAAITGGVLLAQPADPDYDAGTFGVTLRN